MFIKLWLDVKLSTLIAILLLWLIETDVFQLPQLHKHFNVSRHPFFADKAFLFKWTNRRSLKLFYSQFHPDKDGKVLVVCKIFETNMAGYLGYNFGKTANSV